MAGVGKELEKVKYIFSHTAQWDGRGGVSISKWNWTKSSNKLHNGNTGRVKKESLNTSASPRTSSVWLHFWYPEPPQPRLCVGKVEVHQFDPGCGQRARDQEVTVSTEYQSEVQTGTAPEQS